MVEMVFTQRATAHAAQPDPNKRKEKKKKPRHLVLVSQPPLPIQAKPLTLKRAVAATRAICMLMACGLHPA